MHRSQQFKIALAAAGMTGPDFAKRHQVSAPAIWQTVYAKYKSERLDRAIDRFIGEQFRKLGIQQPASTVELSKDTTSKR